MSDVQGAVRGQRMTEEELRAEAERQGFRLQRKPRWDCSCYMPYPNKGHKNKNGSWKCVDRYEPITMEQKSWHSPCTHCRKVEK